MYTGIVTDTGRVVRFERNVLVLNVPADFSLEVGSSLAVNGACLTATALQGHTVTMDVSPETLKRTALGTLNPDDLVNLERPCRVGDTLDGHIVQGHVDTVGRVVGIENEGNARRFTFCVEPRWDRYLIEKGSVALEGISLTVFGLDEGTFSVAVIPHTYSHTNLHGKQPGDPVNVEFDLLGKYTEKLLQAQLARGRDGV